MVSKANAATQYLDDFLRFTGNKSSNGKAPVFILVLGMTGSGKSSLVQHCTGSGSARIGHGLKSCTNDISVHSFHHETHHVYMIDTPGFDDTNRSDIDTLKTISTYLSVSFANNVRINGIVYLHRISDNRLGIASLRNLRMFKKLAGKRMFMNTAIATTMWQSNEYQLGLQRERELMDNVDYFGDVLSKGAKYFRVAEHGTGVDEQQQSALEIVSYLVQQTGILPTLTLNIQRELIAEGKTLDATSAGQEALGDLYHLKLQLTKQLQNAHQDMQKAMTDRDAEHVQQLRVFERDCSQKMTKAQEEQEKIKTSLMDMHDEEVERLQKRLDNMEGAQREELQRKRQELEDMETSLKRMREQSAIDAARWERQRLDIATIRKKQRKNEEVNRECERQVVEIRENVAQEEAQLQSIGQAKSTTRQNIANGAANGATTAITTVVATAVLTGVLCIVM